MAIATSSLNLLAFPQHWDGAGLLSVRFLCLPQGDPEEPLQPGEVSFAAADLQFEARLIGSLDHLPREADARRVVHGQQHVVHESAQIGVDALDGLRLFAQDRIWKREDGTDGHLSR